MPVDLPSIEDAAGNAALSVWRFLQTEEGAPYRNNGVTYETLKTHYMRELQKDDPGDAIRSLLNGGDNAR